MNFEAKLTETNDDYINYYLKFGRPVRKGVQST